MREENIHTIHNLTDRENFVFARPLLPFGTIRDAQAHCTHLQIAQADPQTKICKSVQFFHPAKEHKRTNNKIRTMKYQCKFYSMLIISTLIILLGCKNRNERLNATKSSDESEVQSLTLKTDSINPNRKVGKTIFYIENSESMFGYVGGFTEYVDVISELSEKPEFAEEKTPREFFFINGGEPVQITPIGNNPGTLKTKLNKTGFRCGDISKSNLNSMLQIALNNAIKDTITILISDAIYDIGQPEAPFNALATEGKETRSKFIERLGNGDLQTIIIKLHSHFDGDYFFTSQRRIIRLNQTRPYYIWIFGESQLLNKYFPEEYIKSLNGYADMARFLKLSDISIPYQATPQEKLGEFRLDRINKNKLTNVKTDRNGQGFQFTFATDFSKLPFSDSYLQSTENYSCSDNFKVLNISKVNKIIYEIQSFTPSHFITVFTDRSPFCDLQITLKNAVPNWINETNINSETDIQHDTTHTYGFEFLINAISEAYDYINKETDIVNFNFELTK